MDSQSLKSLADNEVTNRMRNTVAQNTKQREEKAARTNKLLWLIQHQSRVCDIELVLILHPEQASIRTQSQNNILHEAVLAKSEDIADLLLRTLSKQSLQSMLQQRNNVHIRLP